MTSDDSGETSALLTRAAGGDQAALDELFGRYRERLKRMVRLRLNRRLAGRVDDSDVLQEAFPRLTNRSAWRPAISIARHITNHSWSTSRDHFGHQTEYAGEQHRP
ncbi:MAG: hypothetical protein IID44_18360 [Planctomycetes bacterium]|nr:hypothetical protein [Planctomycetota bacterium]